MAVPRILLAAAALTVTALAGLTGCTPAESRPTVAAASSAAALAEDGADEPLDDELDFGDDLGDDGTYTAGPVAAPADPGAPADPDSPADPGASADPAASATPADPADPGASAPECTAPAAAPGHQVMIVVAAGPAELTAQPARFSCAPPRYEATGAPVHYGFAAAGVTATLVDRPNGEAAKPVRLDELVIHLNDCLAERDPADPYGCHGNAYDVVLDPHGRIVRIAEVGVPTP
ncbi:hypothetical protein ACIRVF_23835 [Kitasatospora sp. NPDC101157]|uniref:hypothetical protein n=1 Tax=Kitasatospora sp. NPDC101157 TaxID=3364098 RepID=UPI00382506D7